MPETITVEDRGFVRLIGLNRPEKRNAFTAAMLIELAQAYEALERDDTIRCGVLFAHGPTFTAGLDLHDVAPRIVAGDPSLTNAASVDPWGVQAPRCTKPMVVAVHGKCLTLGIELALAADIVVADETARFAQIEISRGIFPFGGATVRMIQAGGYQNAMRWLLTADEFGVEEAQVLGLVQEVAPEGQALDRAIAIKRLAVFQPSPMAPIRSAAGVRTSLKNTSFVSHSPSRNRMGRTSIPGRSISTSRKTRPSPPALCGLHRARRNMCVAYWAKLVQSLLPVRMKSSPSSSARKVSAERSDPA